MKTYKKYLLAITVAAIFGISAYNINIVSRTDGMTNTMLANLHAMAQHSESVPGTTFEVGCNSCVHPIYGWDGIIMYCVRGNSSCVISEGCVGGLC